MENRAYTGQYITAVDRHSPAEAAGLRPGDILLSINNEQVKDLVDYEALCTLKQLQLELKRGEELLHIHLFKGEYEPLGLCFATGLMDTMRACRNRCVFCFIDQMPKGLRSSLHVKDDDWRLSFIMGNYVSLTNVSREEFARILKRRVSPLYISVHATDPNTRVRLMGNPTAGTIMERLTALKEAGLSFHTQIVLCPGLNDGDILEKSYQELKSLYPACRSIAIVPVGLTRFRDGLYPLRGFTKEEAQKVVVWGQRVTESCKTQLGEDFCYLSDEWYILAGEPLPPYESYEDFPQIENGVGLLRYFEGDFLAALSEQTPLSAHRKVTVAGGVAANSFFKELYKSLLPYNIEIDAIAVENGFFGGNVHVAGLVTASDLENRFKDSCPSPLLIPKNMLKETEPLFLDGVSVAELEERLHTRILPFADGYELIELLFGEKI